MLETIGYLLAGLFIVLVPGALFSIVLWPEGSMDVWSRLGASVCLGFMLLLYTVWALASVRSLFFHTTFLAASGLSIGLFIISLLRGGGELIEAYARGAIRILRGARVKMGRVGRRLRQAKKPVPAPPPPSEAPKPEVMPPSQPQPPAQEPEAPPQPQEQKLGVPPPSQPVPEKREGQTAGG
ncbi:MAG: hypothetical protein QXG38_01340 [Candidatus Hadarchaeales archaeon]